MSKFFLVVFKNNKLLLYCIPWTLPFDQLTFKNFFTPCLEIIEARRSLRTKQAILIRECFFQRLIFSDWGALKKVSVSRFALIGLPIQGETFIEWKLEWRKAFFFIFRRRYGIHL